MDGSPTTLPPRRRGLTLVELVIALAILAVLGTLALPSMGRQIERHRLQAAAQALAADLGEARFEAARRGLPLHLEVRAGDDWCWVVATAPHCTCDAPASCRLKAVRAADHRGVRVVEARDVRFDADGRADIDIAALLEAGPRRMRVQIGTLGRARVCSAAGEVPGVPAC